jgi:uncharacterized protein with HEPN domain
MLDYAREAVAMIEGKNRADLRRERMLELALVRLIEVIGEAAARVTSESREKYGSIPWSQVVGMRNRLIHGYDHVDLDVLWDTIEYDLPPLILELENIIGS